MHSNPRRQFYLNAIGISQWRLRERGASVEKRAADFADENQVSQEVQPPEIANDVGAMGWEALRSAVKACQACELHATRTQTVFGSGNTHARWMIIGEAPGSEEDAEGAPFAGRTSELFDAMLAALKLDRKVVYLTNTIKCRPPESRDPRSAESTSCSPYLQRQIELLQPKVILIMGRIAAHNLLKINEPVGKMRARVHIVPGTDIPAVVTYHPAYLMRKPSEKGKSWADLQLAERVVQGGM